MSAIAKGAGVAAVLALSVLAAAANATRAVDPELVNLTRS